LLARFANAYLFNILLLKRIKHELLELNKWTVNMHATNCIFNLRYWNGNDKIVVCLMLKRYAVRKNVKIWSYVVRMRKKRSSRYAKGEGVHHISLLLINSFNKTEASNFPKHLRLLGAFHFSKINYICQVSLCFKSIHSIANEHCFTFLFTFWGLKWIYNAPTPA